MLGHFPPPYTDENVYSICARYTSRMRQTSSYEVRLRMFGSEYSDLIGFPSHLAQLVTQIPSEFGMTVQDLIWKRTVLPFFRPSFGNDVVIQVAEEMKSQLSTNYRGRLRGISKFPDFLRFCPVCVEEDRRNHNETYWRRQHQLGVVRVCPVHNVLLQTSDVCDRETIRLVPAEQAIPKLLKVQKASPKDPESAMWIWVAEQSYWIMREPELPFTLEQVGERFRFQLSRRGMARYKGKVALSRTLDYCFDKLRKLRIPERIFGGTLMRSLISPQLQGRRNQPFQQLLLLRVLDLTADNFFSSAQYPFSFESGPWPCLNPACKHFHGNVIKNYEEKVTQRGTVLGVFRCDCGFAYRRRGPDSQGLSRLDSVDVIATGPIWDRRLIKLWNANEQMASMCQQLDATDVTVKRAVERLGLSFAKRRSNMRPLPSLHPSRGKPEMRDQYRDQVRTFLATAPDPKRSTLYASHPNAIAWLRRNDEQWLLSVLPAPTPKGYVRPFDWDTRDLEYSSKVPAIKQALLNKPGPPKRMTSRRFLKALGLPQTRVTADVHLPKTFGAIRDSVETPTDVAVRRINWVASGRPAPRGGWTLFALRQAANFPGRWNSNPALVAALRETANRLHIENRTELLLAQKKPTDSCPDSNAA